MTHDEYVDLKKAELVKVARDIITKSTDFLEGIRKIDSLRYEVTDVDHDPDFFTFIELSDDADHIPNKEIESNFSREWIESCNKERADMELRTRKEVEAACMKLINRFTNEK